VTAVAFCVIYLLFHTVALHVLSNLGRESDHVFAALQQQSLLREEVVATGAALLSVPDYPALPKKSDITVTDWHQKFVTVGTEQSGVFNAVTIDTKRAESFLITHGAQAIRKPLSAYLEPGLNDIVPGTGSRGDHKNPKDLGVAPEIYTPLPLRTHTPDALRKVEYPRVQTCHDMPGKFPIDRGLELDKDGLPIVWNVGETPTPDDFPEQEVPFCPVEADPYLPWIHDVFPSPDGTRIHFIAQNRRRCRTGKNFSREVKRLAPQVALMQSVSVERIDEVRARFLAPKLWHPEYVNNTSSPPRYRLAPYEEASPDGLFTRFICRFHAIDFSSGHPRTVTLGETLSEYPFNYEMAAYRKGWYRLLTPKGKDSRFFWTSNLRFDCPLPLNATSIHRMISSGNSILSDGTPTVHLDLVPIRSSVRYNEHYLTEDMIGPKERWAAKGFDPGKHWGKQSVLPRIEASGRWENIPICHPPTPNGGDVDKKSYETHPILESPSKPSKPNFLSACLWASAEFKTRGVKKGADTDTISRLKEWIEFHLMVGFDHIYVYDNTGAHTNATSLESSLAKFPGRVTRIDWPSIVCNNNIPAHDSTGERSSQYAAENSCRTRYAPFTEWIAAFDTDEYFVPMGNYTNLKDVLLNAGAQGTNILSFRSSRGYLRQEHSVSVDDGRALEKSENKTFLEAYNCDSAGSPKPSWAERARKQIYRADYVPYHFVHYSTVTKGLLKEYKDQINGTWSSKFGERAPSERVTDELHEAVMVHTKTIKRDMTNRYKRRCRFDYDKKWQGCTVAYPWPNGSVGSGKETYDENGMEYNCFVNRKVDDHWVPKLREAILHRRLAQNS
jgi:hypothetical protein